MPVGFATVFATRTLSTSLPSKPSKPGFEGFEGADHDPFLDQPPQWGFSWAPHGLISYSIAGLPPSGASARSARRSSKPSSPCTTRSTTRELGNAGTAGAIS